MTSDCNGPIQLSDAFVIDDKPWKCSETNNGCLKASKTNHTNEESLLGSTAVTTVVQMTTSGTKTMVMPRNHSTRERFLLCGLTAAVVTLLLTCVVLLVMVFNNSMKLKHHCTEDVTSRVCLTEECVRTELMRIYKQYSDSISTTYISAKTNTGLRKYRKNAIKWASKIARHTSTVPTKTDQTSSLLAAMDHSADPCEDFFQYACGTWNKKHVIPEDRSSISTFEVMADQLQVVLKGLLEEPIDSQDNGATTKAKIFYYTCMDIRQIRKIGDTSLREVLELLGGWPVTKPNWQPPEFSVEILLGRIRGIYNEGVLVDQWIGPDDKNSSVNIIQMDQMHLALPSRDYYLKASSEGDMAAYHKYMTNIAVLLGANKTTAKEELQEVVDFERRLANASLPEADRHDTSAIYRKLTLQELQTIVPQIEWLKYLRSFLDVDIDEQELVVAYGLSYFIEMGKILAETDRRVIHNYVLWRLIMALSPHMIDDYQKERVEFRKILQGVLSERHRWSQCVEWTNKRLGMAVGALFIRDNFNHESKETALTMIHTIREAFNELLAENDWMDDETRAVAKEKADAMNERIGYPRLITDKEELVKEYTSLNISDTHFMTNVLNVLKFDAEQNLQKLRQPVDKDKWSTEPAVVNAFYNPNKNDIVFPAGILQPLFYSQHFPKSLNYGGIGVVIGHEITHGFDDKGRQFDREGNMMQWWNNATIRAFRERTQCIIDQYSRYKIDEVGLYVNGRMTQGENIADNGGLKQSFRAYRKWVSQYGEEANLPGLNLTHDQLFFLNYAQIWCGSMRPEDALTKVRSSVHSPGPIRVLGPLSNSRDFARAYHCPLGSPMNPTNKCSVW